MPATSTAIATAPDAVATSPRSFLAGTPPSDAQLAAWAEAFHRDGFIFLHDVLPPERCAELIADSERDMAGQDVPTACVHRRFEVSRANLALFDLEPVVTLAEKILGDDCSYGRETAHVVHNNSFRTRDGGGWSNWHQDDAAHFVVTHGEPPTNIHLPCLLLTANYYLTDQETAEHGCGQVLPGSHKWGRRHLPADLAGTEWERHIHTCGGKAGSVMLFNNQVWHRGAPNRGGRTRHVTQVSYGRKMVGHFYAPFMDYRMPAHCLEGASPRLRRLLGFKPCGAYG